MNKELTQITFVLDRSGSMMMVASDTIGGFNSFLAQQRTLPGRAEVTLVQFDHEYEIVYDGLPLEQVPDLTAETYKPRGSTALLDAIGRAVLTTESRIGALSESERPGRVIVVVLTDGAENMSREFNADQVRGLVHRYLAKGDWDFVFLGADLSAVESARNLGVAAANSAVYAGSAVGTRQAFDTVSGAVGSYRSGGKATVNSGSPVVIQGGQTPDTK